MLKWVLEIVLIIAWTLTIGYACAHYGYEAGYTDGRYDLSDLTFEEINWICEDYCKEKGDK